MVTYFEKEFVNCDVKYQQNISVNIELHVQFKSGNV